MTGQTRVTMPFSEGRQVMCITTEDCPAYFCEVYIPPHMKVYFALPGQQKPSLLRRLTGRRK